MLIVPLLFSVPFLLFSIPGGFLADKYSKRSVTIGTVVGQLVVMALATWALAQGRLGWAGVALFLMSTLGAIFGPTKYGLLPELLPESKLSWGNGIIEFLTLLAAILAALAGGYLAHVFHGRQVWSGVIFMALAVVGLLISLGISRVPAADPGRKFDWNVPREFFSEVRHMSGGPAVADGGGGEHVFLVSGVAIVAEYRPVWRGHSASGRDAEQLFAGGVEYGDRAGQPGCGVCVREENSDGHGAAWACGDSVDGCAAFVAGHRIWQRACCC